MGRLPKPDLLVGLSSLPTPAPADYFDEVSDADHEALAKIVAEQNGDDDDEQWELIDGPAW